MKLIFIVAALFINASDMASKTVDGIVLDVRTSKEFSEGHAKTALNIDFFQNDFEKNINQLDKNKKYYVYCKSGGRSAKAIQKMKALGFKNIEDLGTVDRAQEKFGAQTN